MPDEYQPWSPPGNSPYTPVVVQENSLPPQRGGCLTTWLVLAIIGRAILIASYPILYLRPHRAIPALSAPVIALLVTASIFDIVCLAAVFRWRRWGFYGLLVTTVLVSILNMCIGVPPFRISVGVIGIIVLFLLLNSGGSNSAWQNME